MSQQKVDIKKVTFMLLGFGLAKVLYDYLTAGAIDVRGVIFVPIITLGLMYFVDKDRFMIKEDD